MTKTDRRKLHHLEAWGIAQKIHIGERIPVEVQADLRSELYAKYAEKPAYFETARDFGGAVCHAMQNDIKDEIARRQTKKAAFFASITSLDAARSDDEDAETIDVADPNATIEKFFGRLDRAERRRQFRNWKRRFRERVRELSEELRDFLFKLAEACSQEELVTATGLCRKSCYLRRQELKVLFADLLRDHRNIKAKEVE